MGNLGILVLLGFEGWFWQMVIDEASKQYTAFTMGNLGILLLGFEDWFLADSNR